MFPYSTEYEAKQNVPIAAVATAYDHPDTGETLILQVNQVLWFGNTMPHTLLNPNQIRSYGYSLCDDPFDPNRPLGITTDDYFIPFEFNNGIVQITTRTPTQQELQECPYLELTDDAPWDPSSIRTPHSQKPGTNGRMLSAVSLSQTLRQTYPYEYDKVMNGISSIYTERGLYQGLLEQARVSVDTTSKDIVVSAATTGQRHEKVSADRLSENWGIDKDTARRTLKVTTQRGIRYAQHPLTRRYRTDMMQLRYRRLADTWYTDVMFPKVKSVNGDNTVSIMTNGSYVWAYPMRTKADVAVALNEFHQEVGIPRKIVFDGAAEQAGPNTDFMRLIRRNQVDWHVTEPYSPWQNKAEGAIRELKRNMRRLRIKKKIPRRLWNYLLRYTCDIMNLTAKGREGRTNHEMVTGETPDISEYTDFGFYDLVWFWDHPGDEDNPHIGRWLGPSHRIGSALCFYIIKGNGNVVSRSTVQHVTDADMMKEDVRRKVTDLDEGIQRVTEEEGHILETNDEEERRLIETQDDELQGIAPELPDEDQIEYTPDSNDPYVGAEVNMPFGSETMRAKVVKRLRGDDGRPIGRSHENPLLDTRMYEVEYADGQVREIQANLIAENMIAQTDSEGRHFLLLNTITGHEKDESAIKKEDGFVIGRSGNRIPKRTTRGWKFLVEWKDGSTQWVPLRELKDSNPVELAEYAVENGIADEPALSWWVKYTLRKRDRILAKVKTKYWRTSHKFGIELPKTVKEAYEIDRRTGTRHWTIAIEKEMRKIMELGAFEVWEDGMPIDLKTGNKKLPGFQQIQCHMIFDVKLDGSFTRKARFVANGNQTDAPSSLTYASVVSRESVRIALLYASLNDLSILGCDVSNAYLNAPCREKIWFIAGPEFGDDEGRVMLIRKALYGLKSSGASWRHMISQTLVDAGYQNTYADADVWRRRAAKPDGFEYYELVLVYTDDILCVSHQPQVTMDMLSQLYDLKDTVKPPQRYLGANIDRWTLPDGRDVWSMSGRDYLKNSIKTVKEMLKADGIQFPGGKRAERPYPKSYKPELDTTPELRDDLFSRYQQLIGILRWAVELGRIDIALEVSLLSSFLCMPREGHMNAVYNIFGYLDKHMEGANLVFDDKIPQVDESVFETVDWAESVYGDQHEELPPNMPEPLGNPVVVSCFVDANHAGDLITRRSHTGILLYVNNSPIVWFSKKQTTVESSTFGSEFVAARIAADIIEAIRYKLRMFGIPVEGPANLFCDNRSVVVNTSRPDSRLNKKHNAICFHRVREAAARKILRVGKEDTESNLADLLTKVLDTPRRFNLMKYIYPKGG